MNLPSQVGSKDLDQEILKIIQTLHLFLFGRCEWTHCSTYVVLDTGAPPCWNHKQQCLRYLITFKKEIRNQYFHPHNLMLFNKIVHMLRRSVEWCNALNFPKFWLHSVHCENVYDLWTSQSGPPTYHIFSVICCATVSVDASPNPQFIRSRYF